MIAMHKGQVGEGGYEYEFVDEVTPKYICSICTKVLKNARLAECCGQHFCDPCLTLWTRKSPSCPYCRSSGFRSIINKEKIREINEFRVRCIHKANGCEWLGQLSSLEEHHQSKNGCSFVKVVCGNEGIVMNNFGYKRKRVVCNTVVERRYLATHKQDECKYRRYRCEYCNYTDTYEAIAESGPARNSTKSHYSTCDCYPLNCPNTCGSVGIKLKDMKAHCNTCPLENLRYPFNGCDISILRKDMNMHRAKCDFRPYTCEYCGTNGTFLSITNKGNFKHLKASHDVNCQHYPLECINRCGVVNIKCKDMETHKNTCPLQPLDCPLGRHSSGNKILRKDMEKHTREVCEFRPFTCQYCNTAGTFKSITGKGETPLKTMCHYDVCDHYPLECPNRCGAEKIKRRAMSQHQSMCPLEPLDCPFKYVKCNETLLRKDVDSPSQKNMQNHLLLLAKSHEELTYELAKAHEELNCRVQELSLKCEKKESKNPKSHPSSWAGGVRYPGRHNHYYYDNY